MSETHYRCERASSAHTEGLLALFEAAGSGCFCNYWHFDGDKNAWLESCYLKPEQNRAALRARLSEAELCGVVARTSDSVCGWLKVMRESAVPRLYAQRVYRNLPCFQAEPGARDDVYAVSCCYVAEAERGRGVASSLLRTAIDLVQELGGVAVEAFPRAAPSGEKLRPDEIWMGPEELFHSAGFAPVSDFRPYPVLRLNLR
ncbi:MAG TPA: GNAT family N-acetyltransferase [Polyangiaceae bacterium]|nr:GNAT family N-acetyltransferase [Polyangiaceae bacterium]